MDILYIVRVIKEGRMRMARHEEMKAINAHRILIHKPERKKTWT
jgi:hypothetical protein